MFVNLVAAKVEKGVRTSFGQVMILGNSLGFSFCPLTIASMMLG
jgi:hypothetical protein